MGFVGESWLHVTLTRPGEAMRPSDESGYLPATLVTVSGNE